MTYSESLFGGGGALRVARACKGAGEDADQERTQRRYTCGDEVHAGLDGGPDDEGDGGPGGVAEGVGAEEDSEADDGGYEASVKFMLVGKLWCGSG